MDRNAKLDLMWKRFVHDDSGFARQHYADGTDDLKEGTYFFRVTEGTCTHEPKHDRKKQCPDVTERTFERRHLAVHLQGKQTYAPYQLSKDGTVKWVCLDVDAYRDTAEEDIRSVTVEVVRSVQSLLGPNHCLVEASGSKGYHVWLFFDRPTPVHQAFELGHTVIQTISLPDDIHIEVYPKQQTNRVFGNTVKLPLGIHRKTGKRCLFVNRTFEPFTDQWSALQHVRTISADWVREHIRHVPDTSSQGNYERQYTAYVPLCLTEVLANGCQEGMRDEVAFREACYLRSKGIPEDLVMGMMMQWNRKNSPPMEDDDVRMKVAQAFSETYSWKPCHLPSFDHLCQSSCVYFEKKKELRWFAKEGNPVGKISRE